LLDAALALLGERRSLDFSLAEVADRAGYSRGMPTHIFGTRDEMIRQLVPHLHVRSGFLFGAPDDRGSGIDAVFCTAALLLDDSQEQADLTIAIHVLLAEAASAASPFRAEVAKLNEAATDYIWRNLEAAVAKGEIAPLHCTKSTSIIVMAMVRGSLLQWLADPAVPLATLRGELLSVLRSLFVKAGA
jgi:AcrR family transcriptional regulator